MRPAFYDSSAYKKEQSGITKKYWRLGTFDFKIKPFITRSCNNPKCKLPFQVKPADTKIYCSSRCAAIINNSKRLRKFYFCRGCKQQIYKSDRKYCAVKCQRTYEFTKYILRWRQGRENGNIGITTRDTSGYIRRYLKEKFGDKCSRCGWDQKHPKTLVVPLEVNHIDGNAENNEEENLELICPNCHALTPNFRNLNKGNGRNWRVRLK